MVPDGLAFGTTGDLHALISVGSSGDRVRHYRVTTIPAPARQPLTLTADEDYYPRGTPVRLVAHVEPRLLPQHPEISIQARPHGLPARSVMTEVRPDAWGNVTLTTTFLRPVTFSAQVHYGAAEATSHLCLNLAYVGSPCR